MVVITRIRRKHRETNNYGKHKLAKTKRETTSNPRNKRKNSNERMKLILITEYSHLFS